MTGVGVVLCFAAGTGVAGAPASSLYALRVVRFWIKQFGLERSGTNYAKALVEMSCPDVRVLATMLGSKHAAPDLDHHVALLEQGDVGIAITDLQASDYPKIVSAYRDRSMVAMLCIRDAVTWVDAYERHRARREKRDAVTLDRDRLQDLAVQWVEWIYAMHDWSETTPLRTLWVVHHQVVRHPRLLLDQVAFLGASCGDPVDVGYLRKAGDQHGSENMTSRPYRTRQYRDVYSGAGQIEAVDVGWFLEIIEELDTRGIARTYLWDRKPLRRRGRS